MAQLPHARLSRRERQIMDIVYRLGRATAAEVRKELPDPPSYSAVRAALRVLEDKGELRHEQEGQRYLYVPILPREEARSSALRHLVRTFFNGRPEQVVSALVEDTKVSPSELERMAQLIEKARKEGR
ncbi:MAG TPA: BlaI/MecI/CopY family transcriptional regulator [Longimicrobiaceae bacterium]|nr:BlaI/MecI/CopY family transcriptional regulator [Longimicrobiaceae bacterium]